VVVFNSILALVNSREDFSASRFISTDFRCPPEIGERVILDVELLT
jgi:hypothetical protein